MTHNPTRLAQYLRDTADLVDLHGQSTRQLLESDWSGDISAGSYEARVSGGELHSDPTFRQATEPQHAMHPRVLLQSWREAHNVIAGVLPRSEPLATLLRFRAHEIATYSDDRRNGLFTAAQTITNLIHMCRPLSPDVAAKMLAEEEHGKNRAECCRACESPTGPSLVEGKPNTKIVSGMCKPGCYEVMKDHERRGIYIDDATFVSHIVGGVARGEINRPASPYWMSTAPKHVPEVA